MNQAEFVNTAVSTVNVTQFRKPINTKVSFPATEKLLISVHVAYRLVG